MPGSTGHRAIPALACILMVLSACDRASTVDTGLHGVNYSGETFSYSVKNPAATDASAAGGELVDPFAAGGTMCCVSLPNTWKPGLMLQVNTTHWLKMRPDGELPEIHQTHLVEVPPYVDGKPGELWVLRASDGGISVVSSDFQPDHPKWPGKVKGWPVASLEYRRERWKLILDHEEGGVRDAISLLQDLDKDPHKATKDAWESAKEYQPLTIKDVAGPDDPKYVDRLRKQYEEALKYSRGRVKQLLEAKP